MSDDRWKQVWCSTSTPFLKPIWKMLTRDSAFAFSELCQCPVRMLCLLHGLQGGFQLTHHALALLLLLLLPLPEPLLGAPATRQQCLRVLQSFAKCHYLGLTYPWRCSCFQSVLLLVDTGVRVGPDLFLARSFSFDASVMAPRFRLGHAACASAMLVPIACTGQNLDRCLKIPCLGS